MRIDVRAEHIETAKCSSPQHCMIAEAIRDCVRRVMYVGVRTNGITITQSRKNGGSVRTHWMVPLKAARAIVDFDAGKTVRPFSFEPELVSRKELPALTEEQKTANRTSMAAKRATMKAEGKTEPRRRQRIAGV